MSSHPAHCAQLLSLWRARFDIPKAAKGSWDGLKVSGLFEASEGCRGHPGRCLPLARLRLCPTRQHCGVPSSLWPCPGCRSATRPGVPAAFGSRCAAGTCAGSDGDSASALSPAAPGAGWRGVLRCCACLWASRRDPACDLSALSLPSLPSVPAATEIPGRLSQLSAHKRGWQRRGYFIPLPPSGSRSPAGSSQGFALTQLHPHVSSSPWQLLLALMEGAPHRTELPSGRKDHRAGSLCMEGATSPPSAPAIPSQPWESLSKSPLSPSTQPPHAAHPTSTRPGWEHICALLPQLAASQCALGGQRLASCISSAASLNCKRHPIFWKLNSDNKSLGCSQEPSVCALAGCMFVLSLDNGRNSLARMSAQRDGAEAEPGCAGIWQHCLQPLDADVHPLPSASAQVACAVPVLSSTLDETSPSTNTSR